MRSTRKKLFQSCCCSFHFAAFFKRQCKTCGKPYWLSYFDRSTKPLQLTEVGKHYIQAVEKVMDIENNLENYLLDLGNLKTGTLNVGGSNFFLRGFCLPLLLIFPKFPHVQISLVEESTAKLSQFLQAGKLDLVIDNCILDNQILNVISTRKNNFFLQFPKLFNQYQTAEISDSY